MATIRQINYFKYQQAKICIKHTSNESKTANLYTAVSGIVRFEK